MKKPNLAAMSPEVAKAIEEMMAEQGEMFSLEKSTSRSWPGVPASRARNCAV